ncbi:competence protein ComEA helix-hairpin-helix region [Oceanococcus atlanticus]|uniref:Competence protein ComEA helix-hairpin-helix region n=1 Tax=Oceanococcus atlanticus TaxID=1317117 RepID=A0A1Y1SFE8_9GAMM|nr:helix-hairpin-helix domain-containing protein [Oceanococcus atlanticus]ORE87414.1 competence protein ComEA helix-hairpin-helix region [Oceanococcus atlanticus]
MFPRIKFAALSLATLIAAPAFAGPVNINTADATTLDQELHGVGPAIAQRIVEFRDDHGAFKSADQLTLVKGIGDKTLSRNAEFILLK